MADERRDEHAADRENETYDSCNVQGAALPRVRARMAGLLQISAGAGRRLSRSMNLPFKLDDPCLDLIKCVPHDKFVPRDKCDDGIRCFLDGLDKIAVDHDGLAVEPP